MTSFNRYLVATFVILLIFPVARAAVRREPEIPGAEIFNIVGNALVPFCARIVRGVDAYKKDQKAQLSCLVKDDVLVGATTTGACIIQIFPKWYSLNDRVQSVTVEGAQGKYYVSHSKPMISNEFDTEDAAKDYLKEKRSEAKNQLGTISKGILGHFGLQVIAFPLGYATGYNLMKLRARVAN